MKGEVGGFGALALHGADDQRHCARAEVLPVSRAWMVSTTGPYMVIGLCVA